MVICILIIEVARDLLYLIVHAINSTNLNKDFLVYLAVHTSYDTCENFDIINREVVDVLQKYAVWVGISEGLV